MEEKLARKRAKGSNTPQNQEIEPGQEIQPGGDNTSDPTTEFEQVLVQEEC